MKRTGGGLLGDFGATLASRYGIKGFDFLILAAISRLVPLELIGGVFLAEAAGRLAFRAIDLGLYPVLQRSAARRRLSGTLHRRALAVRLLSAAALTAGYAGFAWVIQMEHAEIAVTFFALAGLRQVHEVPRAALAGTQGFVPLAKINLGSKAAELALAVVAAWAGLGIWGWALGRFLGHLGLLAAVLRVVRPRLVPEAPGDLPALVREGLPFWATTLLLTGSAQLDLLILGATGGLSDTADLGIATKIVGGALSIVGALTFVAFPRLARERSRYVSRPQVLVVGGMAVGLGVLVALAAPVLTWLIAGEARPQLTSTIRMMTPVIVLGAVGRPLQVWLQAKDKELSLVALALVVGVTSATAFGLLVPSYGAAGAAWARVLRAAIELAGAAALVAVAVRAPRSVAAWLLAHAPGGAARVRRWMTRRVDAFVARAAQVEGVRSVEVVGSARSEAAFEPGVSDVDLLVVTDGPPTAAARALTRGRDRLFPRHVTVIDAELLGWARRLGHPLLAAEHGEARAGPRVDPDPDPAQVEEAERSNAIGKLLKLQRILLDEGRLDGSARARPTLKTLHYLRWRLGLPADRWPAPRDGWLPPEEVARLLAEALQETGRVLGARAAEWGPPTSEPPDVPAWIEALSPAVRRRFDEGPALEGIQLTPTGPTDDDPMLVCVLRDPTAEAVRAWLSAQTARGPLPPRFRTLRWPILLPEGALLADAWIEHAPLFHRARAAGALTLAGTVPAGRTPPEEVRRHAALRSTIHALMRIETARGAPAPAACPPRLRALVRARLAALSLELDEGRSPADPAEVAARYAAAHDDALAALLARGAVEPTGAEATTAVRAWADERRERLRGLLEED